MLSLSQTETVNAPVSTVFAYVSDYRHIQTLLPGITSWTPKDTSRLSGVGAQFTATLDYAGIKGSSDVTVTKWVPDQLIELTTNYHGPQIATFTFAPNANRTVVRADVSVNVGGVAAFMAKGLIQAGLRQALANMRNSIETAGRSMGAQQSQPSVDDGGLV